MMLSEGGWSMKFTVILIKEYLYRPMSSIGARIRVECRFCRSKKTLHPRKIHKMDYHIAFEITKLWILIAWMPKICILIISLMKYWMVLNSPLYQSWKKNVETKKFTSLISSCLNYWLIYGRHRKEKILSGK